MSRRQRLFLELLLRIYPRWFREARHEDLRSSYEDVLREAPPRDRAATAWWLIQDALTTAVRVRMAGPPAGAGTTTTNGRKVTMRSVIRELRYALRSLAKSPEFAAVTILTMGIGIGANTAIFSVIYGVLLAPVPYEESERVVQVQNRYLQSGGTGWVSAAELSEFRAVSSALDGVVPISPENMNLTGLPTPRLLHGLRIGPGFFDLLGVEPVLGREFVPEEGEPGGASVVMLGEGLWTSAYGADPEILGRSVEIDGAARTVVGIVGADYRPISDYFFPGRDEVFWIPLVIDPATFDARTVERHNLLPVARLAEGVDRASAESAMVEAVRRLAERYPDLSNADSRDVVLTPLSEQALGGAGNTLALLAAAVALVLLIACVNVATLLLARAERPSLAERGARRAGRRSWASAVVRSIRSARHRFGGGLRGARAHVARPRRAPRSRSVHDRNPRRGRAGAARLRVHPRALSVRRRSGGSVASAQAHEGRRLHRDPTRSHLGRGSSLATPRDGGGSGRGGRGAGRRRHAAGAQRERPVGGRRRVRVRRPPSRFGQRDATCLRRWRGGGGVLRSCAHPGPPAGGRGVGIGLVADAAAGRDE